MQNAHDDRVGFRFPVLQQQRRQRGRHGEGGEQPAGDGVGIGFGHRAEDMSLDPAHGEQRDEAGDDDGGGEEDALVHLGRRVRDHREFAAEFRGAAGAVHGGGAAEPFRWRLRQSAEDIFHHDNGRIHDQAEIDRTDRKQIGGFTTQQHQPDREGEREGNGGGHDDGAAEIPQEDPLQQENERDSLQHVVQDGVRGQVDQVGAIVDPFQPHAGRQDPGLVDLVHQRFHPLNGRQAFRAAAHQDDALHDVVFIVLTGDAQTRQMIDADLRDIAHINRGAVVGGQQGITDLIHRMDQPQPSHHRRLGAEIHRLAADIDVGVVQRGEHRRDRQAVMFQLALIDRDLIGLGLSAPAIDVDDAGHRLEAAFQHPILDRLEIGDRVAGRPHDAVAQDFPDRTFRGDLRHDVIG